MTFHPMSCRQFGKKTIILAGQLYRMLEIQNVPSQFRRKSTLAKRWFLFCTFFSPSATFYLFIHFFLSRQDCPRLLPRAISEAAAPSHTRSSRTIDTIDLLFWRRRASLATYRKYELWAQPSPNTMRLRRYARFMQTLCAPSVKRLDSSLVTCWIILLDNNFFLWTVYLNFVTMWRMTREDGSHPFYHFVIGDTITLSEDTAWKCGRGFNGLLTEINCHLFTLAVLNRAPLN